MRESSRSGWSWRFAVGLVLIAALAQACGGSSSQSTGSETGRAEFRFSQVKATRLGALPQGCTQVTVTLQPGNLVFSLNDTQGSFVVPAGQYEASASVLCNGTTFTSDPPNPVVIVPAGLGQVQVSFVFGGVNVILTVRVGQGVSVSIEGVSCPGGCTRTFFAGTAVKLTANNPAAVFTGGCNGTGSCVVLLNQDKTVFVSLGVTQDGFIQANVSTCCGTMDAILIDGVVVASEVPAGSSVTRKVSPGNHLVAGDCGEGGPSESVNVSPGETEVVNLSCD
jgi:hypothetical protein